LRSAEFARASSVSKTRIQTAVIPTTETIAATHEIDERISGMEFITGIFLM
jgi:hypothetical protein